MQIFFFEFYFMLKKKKKKRNPTNFFKHRIHRLALYNICCRERVSLLGGEKTWKYESKKWCSLGEMTKFSPPHETMMIKNSWY